MRIAEPTRSIAIAGAVLAAAFAAGWFTPTSTEPAVRARASTEAPAFVHPGGVIAEAARRFQGGGTTPAFADAGEELDTSIDVSDNVAPPKPPPIDIATRFRSELSAVVIEGGEANALMSSGERGLAKLAAGSPYRDGWRVASVSTSAIVLQRRTETRRIAVMGEYQQAANDVVPGDAPRGRLLLTRQDARSRRP